MGMKLYYMGILIVLTNNIFLSTDLKSTQLATLRIFPKYSSKIESLIMN